MTDNNTIKDFQVDAVISWVDGNDEVYKAKILPYLKEKGDVTKTLRSRYAQVDEIEYTVKSILKYAPFINSIFIVTDNQVPEFLKLSSGDDFSRVKVVDHQQLFEGYDDFLPTFNSRTIETCLHKIPNLSEHFIYLNDDFFIINPTTKNDFFTENGNPVLRGIWQQFQEKKLFKKDKTEKAGHKEAQEKAAKVLGFKKFFRFRHTPHPMRKSTLVNFFSGNPEILKDNIKYRFRNRNQFLPVALANHIEIKNKTCVLRNDLQLLYFRSYKKPLYWYKFKLNISSKKKLFLGLQSLNKSPDNILNYILNWLSIRTN
ncbi:Stealth CR1 domain-containing protein [Winogradskyella flava]|uniref:Stealth CR1 domain-containing protein n=1 Tax=Winogradskyella flava TaxID=1884876 RepID=A0A842IR30_9FLAO|nr:Stealth CR1 domain-containing protein [Winogradskyella flava]MBC2845662.1 Stealth CR1 domain-containing protein [Winogradskyella flava]